MTITTQRLKEDTQPRLDPVEDPNSIKLKLAYWYTNWQIGKIITPLKVLYSRFPEGIGLSKELQQLDQKFTLSQRLMYMIKVYVATLNGCAFCIDIGKASAQQEDLDPSIFEDLIRFEECDQYSEAEKAALAYADEATRNKHVAGATFERLQQHFEEREIVQITLLNAIENFYNLTNAPLNISSDELCEL